MNGTRQNRHRKKIHFIILYPCFLIAFNCYFAKWNLIIDDLTHSYSPILFKFSIKLYSTYNRDTIRESLYIYCTIKESLGELVWFKNNFCMAMCIPCYKCCQKCFTSHHHLPGWWMSDIYTKQYFGNLSSK